MNNSSVMEMTEVEDFYEPVVFIDEISFRGSGMTIGQRLTLVDGNGALIATRTILAAAENEFLSQTCSSVRGVRVSQIPDGAVSIMIRYK
jgi:hypothetical protein